MRNRMQGVGRVGIACFTPRNGRRAATSFQLVLCVLGVLGLLACLVLPNVRRTREVGHRIQCKSNLKQIGLALHIYHDEFGSFPPVYTVDADGKPLHSWRTLILPYMDQKPLYDKIDLSKPWNDPANAEAFKTRVPAYQCRGAPLPEGHTTYLGVAAPGCVFSSLEPTKIRDIKDGASSTLMVIEGPVDQSVHWMAPVDADESYIMGFGEKTRFSHVRGTNALRADGEVRFLPVDLDSAVRRALISIDAGDIICGF